MSSQACKRCIVRGRVQGVFYRASTREEARRLGLRGWARNRSDGSVEVLVAGPDEQVQALLRWLWQGPPHAAVTAVEVEDTEADLPEGFLIG